MNPLGFSSLLNILFSLMCSLIATSISSKINSLLPYGCAIYDYPREIFTLLLKDYDIDIIISSPLTRTRQTAEIINEGRNIKTIYDKRIIERDYGEYEGYQKHEFEYLDYWRYKKNLKYKKAENVQDFYKRIYAFIEDAKQRYNDKTVLLVIHGGISVAINAYFFGIPSEENPTYGSLKNCEVKVFDL